MPSKLWLNFSLQLSSPLLSLSLLPWLVWGITVPKGHSLGISTSACIVFLGKDPVPVLPIFHAWLASSPPKTVLACLAPLPLRNWEPQGLVTLLACPGQTQAFYV